MDIEIRNGAIVVKKLHAVNAALQKSMAGAMDDIKELVAHGAVSEMRWKKPSGRLARSVLIDSNSDTWSARIGSNEPHARRRNFGFSGKTDRLGRFYPHDPGGFYLNKALSKHRLDIKERVNYAVIEAFDSLGIPIQ